MTLTPGNQPTGIRLPVFILVAVMIVVGALVAVWFAVPGPDNQHRLVSPSGTKTLELAELCTPNGCNRVAILDQTQPDGSHLRTGCPLAPASLTPLFAQVTARWSANEDRLDVDYVAQSGSAGTLTFIVADCIQTQ